MITERTTKQLFIEHCKKVILDENKLGQYARNSANIPISEACDSMEKDNRVWILKEDVEKNYVAMNKVKNFVSFMKPYICGVQYSKACWDSIIKELFNPSPPSDKLEEEILPSFKGDSQEIEDNNKQGKCESKVVCPASKEDIYLHRECSCGIYFKVLEKDNKPWHRMLCPQCQLKMNKIIKDKEALK